VSLDNTYKVASKAMVVDKDGTRMKLLKGGILSLINEINEILAWVSRLSYLGLNGLADYLWQRFCQTASAAEIEEVLEGIKKRCLELGVPLPDLVVVDNCCNVRNTVAKVLPDAHVVLDVFHFIKRWVELSLGVTHKIN